MDLFAIVATAFGIILLIFAFIIVSAFGGAPALVERERAVKGGGRQRVPSADPRQRPGPAGLVCGVVAFSMVCIGAIAIAARLGVEDFLFVWWFGMAALLALLAMALRGGRIFGMVSLALLTPILGFMIFAE